ncbi:hypothetical protein Tco_0882440 [Tanacetum coccineum]
MNGLEIIFTKRVDSIYTVWDMHRWLSCTSTWWGTGGGEDPSRPPPTSFVARCLSTEVRIFGEKGKRKPNLGGMGKRAGNPGKKDTEQVLKDARLAAIKSGHRDRSSKTVELDNTVVPYRPLLEYLHMSLETSKRNLLGDRHVLSSPTLSVLYAIDPVALGCMFRMRELDGDG